MPTRLSALPPDTRIAFEGMIESGLLVRSWFSGFPDSLATGLRWMDDLRQARIDSTGVPFHSVRLLVQLPATGRLSTDWYPGDQPLP
jgi:hypothetical protein